MSKKRNAIRITKQGKGRIDALLDSLYVHNYHKTLLKAIKDRIPRNNVSKADCEIFETISKGYEGKLI